LYWNELIETYNLGHSVIVFQYFPRMNHRRLINMLANQIHDRVVVSDIVSLATSRVVYFLLLQPKDSQLPTRCCEKASRVWNPILQVYFHCR
jgi:hypothetical protein